MRRKILLVVKRWLVIVIIAIPLLFYIRKSFVIINAYYNEAVYKKRILILSAENELLKRRIEDYKKGILIDVKARDDLGMIKKGEKVIFVER